MTSSNETASDPRLPRTADPRRYELRLAPDLASATFTGEVRIDLDVREPVSELVLNAIELEIDQATLSSSGGEPVEATISLDEDEQRLTLGLPEEVAPGAYVLEIRFSGILNDQLRGFYRSTFSDDPGTEHVIATTQFQATDARRAFPCWDEPDRKAVFSVTLDVPEAMTAVSNGPEIASEPLADGARRVRFGETIPMSTYLVAFIVGPLEVTTGAEDFEIPIRVIHPPGKAHLTAFPFEVAAHALRFYIDWFGLPYPGAKLDMIAIPDFAAGAMENLGAVTFREVDLLVDPARASHSEIERVTEVIAHEIAHMWFGDLVTMRWWNGIWLNEAFATFMSLLCLDAFRPEWRTWDSFSRSRAAALQIDALHSTRPIEYPVHRPEDADGMFDLLTYEKGASVLRMVERYVGAARFRDGVRAYLAAHIYGNTETTDLWDAIEEIAGDEPIRELMDSWILQGGYPLVEVGPAAGDEGAVTISERPFALLPEVPAGAPSGIGRDWLVPLILAPAGSDPGGDAEDGYIRSILAADPITVAAGDGRLVIANAGGHGFYRVKYESELFGRVLGRFGELLPLERYCFVSDAWACAQSGAGSVEDFLRLAHHLADETDANVWTIVTGALGTLDRAVAEADRSVLQAFCSEVLAPQLARVGWDPVEDEDPQTATLRSALITTLGIVGADSAVRTECEERFAASRDSGVSLEPGTAGAVLGVVSHFGGKEEFEAILEGYRKPSDPQDEQRHLTALTFVTHPSLAAEFHELCLNGVRTQDAPFALLRAMLNRHIRDVTWEFVSSRWDDLVARYPRSTLPRMLMGIIALDEVEADGSAPLREAARAFVAAHPLEGMQKMVDQHLEVLDVNVAFIRRERSRLGRLLEQS